MLLHTTSLNSLMFTTLNHYVLHNLLGKMSKLL